MNVIERGRGGVDSLVSPRRLSDFMDAEFITEILLRLEENLISDEIWTLLVV